MKNVGFFSGALASARVRSIYARRVACIKLFKHAHWVFEALFALSSVMHFIIRRSAARLPNTGRGGDVMISLFDCGFSTSFSKLRVISHLQVGHRKAHAPVL